MLLAHVYRRERSAPGGAGVRGFVFYHTQDLARRSRGERLVLSFGALNSDELAAVGNEVAWVLRNGLVVTWYGSVERRIYVAIQVFGW